MSIGIRAGLIPALGLVLLAEMGCSVAGEEGKIPVTTASAEARQHYLQGQELFENLEILDSRSHLEKAVAADPDFALGHLRLAFTQTTPNDFRSHVQEAAALADKASKGERLWIQAVEAGAFGNPTRATELFRELAAAYPNDERAHFLLGGNLFGQQNWTQAIEHYRKAIAINPKYPAPYNQMGYALRFSGNNEEAEKVFQDYVKLIPNNPNPHDSYAELLLALGRYDESVASYRKALSVDATFVASRIGVATNLNFLGRHQEAREE
ncbi:MAG: tetratricopeptide repeat protein, partial [Terriglobia bacterium]